MIVMLALLSGWQTLHELGSGDATSRLDVVRASGSVDTVDNPENQQLDLSFGVPAGPARNAAMKNKILIGLGIVIVLIGTFAAVKKVSPVSWGMWGDNNAASGVALKGYDPVAYFIDGEPILGDPQHTHQWGDVTWQFASDENRVLFSVDPAGFAPQFGGFCSFAVSKGFTADILPEAWHIVDGKLYVFADENVRDEWVTGLDDGSLDKSTENWAQR